MWAVQTHVGAVLRPFPIASAGLESSYQRLDCTDLFATHAASLPSYACSSLQNLLPLSPEVSSQPVCQPFSMDFKPTSHLSCPPSPTGESWYFLTLLFSLIPNPLHLLLPSKLVLKWTRTSNSHVRCSPVSATVAEPSPSFGSLLRDRFHDLAAPWWGWKQPGHRLLQPKKSAHT